MADVSQVKLPNGTTYTLKDEGALQLTGGNVTGAVSFGDSVSIDDATIGNLVVNGNASFVNAKAITNQLIDTLDIATANWTDDTLILTSDATGDTNLYYRRAAVRAWNYIKNKLDSSLTTNKLIYANSNTQLTSIPNIAYFTGNNTASTPATYYRLHIHGAAYGNTAANMISGTAGLFSFGDGGPQITFDTNATPGGGQAGALIYTDHDTAGTGVSWHFVSNQTDWNVTSKRFHARTSISIGTNLPPIRSGGESTTYALYVEGTTRGSSNIDARFSGIGASKTNNNVSSTTYPTTFNILDSAGRILTRQEGVIYANGNIGSYWYVRNYNTSGTQIGQKGIQITMTKDGTLTYDVADPAKFRSAISAAQGASSGAATWLEVPRVGNANTINVNSAPEQYKGTVKEYGPSCLNLPTSAWYFVETWRGADNNYCAQLALGESTDDAYFRILQNTVWGNWRRITTGARNITMSTSAPSGGSNGDIWFVYA